MLPSPGLPHVSSHFFSLFPTSRPQKILISFTALSPNALFETSQTMRRKKGVIGMIREERPLQSCCNHQAINHSRKSSFQCVQKLNLIPDQSLIKHFLSHFIPALRTAPDSLPIRHSESCSQASEVQKRDLVSELHNLNSVQLEPKLSKLLKVDHFLSLFASTPLLPPSPRGIGKPKSK